MTIILLVLWLLAFTTAWTAVTPTLTVDIFHLLLFTLDFTNDVMSLPVLRSSAAKYNKWPVQMISNSAQGLQEWPYWQYGQASFITISRVKINMA